ncbi:hypothetical protein DHW03_18500 [Pedobacter yonginense]|uniref:Uncharacterized protein n=1 Tax=Pedobacter yonginense TaxID=651869 RepID=A0A317ELX8_9SPHI|nr:hypothetical protein [Pedobacter yonginense]PWS26038.1 hypothetical protein DHW03_18500 [Pedobacter yonginense]
MNIQVFLISILIFLSTHLETTPPIKVLRNTTSRDFFKDTKYVHTAWLGFLQSKDSKKLISNVPMFIYDNKADGYGKIVCVPKSLEGWNAKFKGKTKAEKISIGRTLFNGILNNSIGDNNFTIYTFFTNTNELDNTADLQKGSYPKFPSTVYIYEKTGTKWNLVTQKAVRTVAEYSDLQFKIAKGL